MIYTDVMLDLETMGKRRDAAIVAIGAVGFNLAERAIGDTFEVFIDLEDCVKMGGKIDASTALWWMQQTKQAQEATFKAKSFDTLSVALGRFTGFCESLCGKNRSLKVWGNSVAFDNAILRETYERMGLSAPWEWWNDMCYRTKKNEARSVCIVQEGIKHNAKDDALSQVKHLFAIYDWQKSNHI